ncbi:unnamed protein product [Lampetra fluviatilis]
MWKPSWSGAMREGAGKSSNPVTSRGATMNMELEALQKEETTLLELRKLFQDQLNRLKETRRCVDDADSLNRMALQLDTMPFGNQGEQEMEEQDEEEDEEEEVAEDDYEDDGDED